MKITPEEKQKSQCLVEKLLANKDRLPYINIGNNNEYLGWVKDFKLRDNNNQTICLNLMKDKDLFLLFVLAIVWSRTGIWENSAFFVSYLKLNGKDSVDFWQVENNWTEELKNRKESALSICKALNSQTAPRKKISFRKDIFPSINILATNWQQILEKLQVSEHNHNFIIFMEYMRNLEGLGVGNRRVLIKIPLILRELRCQNIYKNIPGELCCVADDRVIKAGKSLGISISKPTELNNLIKSSTKIYNLFGDLYDLPLFAYNDLK